MARGRRTSRTCTSGRYAAGLLLKHVIPEIEASPVVKDGELIDVEID